MSAHENPGAVGTGVSEGSPAAKQIVPEDKTPRAPRKPLDDREYLLGEIRLARSWAEVWRAQIDTVGIALKARWITQEKAVEELENCPFFRPLVDGGGK
jgi:hypothetical protein